MSDPQAQQQQAPPPPPMVAPTLDEVLASLLHAVDTAARASTGSGGDIREVREYGAAALSFSQSYVLLHPGLVSPQGLTPDQVASSVPVQTPAPVQKPEPGAKLPQPTPSPKRP